MSSYLDKTGLERVWSRATSKFATNVETEELGGRILNLETNSATKQEVSDEVAKLVDSAPETLDTLNELAAALGDDPNFATTMATEIGKKVNSSDYNDAIGSINSHISTINGEIDELQEASEQHLNKEDYLGPIIKEGNPIVYDNGVEGFDIKVETTFSPKQQGSGEPSPENIRPITGWDALNLNHTGKNLFDPNRLTYGDDFYLMGGEVAYDANIGVCYLSVNVGETYAFTVNGTGHLRVAQVDQYKGFISRQVVPAGNTYVLITDVGTAYVQIAVENTIELQMEKGGTPTSYEPFNGMLHTVQLDRTVYGGKFDWLTGKLIVDKGYIVFNGTEKWVETIEGNIKYIYYSPTEKPQNGYVVCSHMPFVYDYQGNGTYCHNKLIIVGAGMYSRYGTIAKWKEFLAAEYAAGTPVQIAYKLATPIEIQLTPTQISELEGINTLYGDGDSIRAIFKSTGGTSTTLETISGVLPVEKGGTGATSAAGARSNLGITPTNIGAFPATGGDITGSINAIRNDTNGATVGLSRIISGKTLSIYATVSSGGIGYITSKAGSETVNSLWLYGNETVLDKPLTISSGGTGASDAATARANLGITPANIGALSTSGGTLNGSILLDGGTNWKAYRLQRTISNAVNEVQIGISDDSSLEIIKKKDGSTINYMALQTYATSFGKPVGISSGGTGATDAVTARTNLDVPSRTGSGASGSWGISVTGSSASCTGNAATATKATQDANGNVITSTYLKLSGGNVMTPAANGNLTASDVSGSWLRDNQFGLCSIGRGNGDGASIGTSGKANIFIKSWYGVGFVDMNTGGKVAVAIDCRAGNVLASTFTGSGANLTSLNAGNISSGTLAVARGGTGITSNPSMLVNLGSTSAASVFAASPRPGITGTLGIANGGTGATSKSGARTNLGITSGTTLPSSASAGDIFFLYS